jgi:hypothetical protein
MNGQFFRITQPESGILVWLAILDNASGHFWVYDCVTRAFHIKRGLVIDYVHERELAYEPISTAEALLRLRHDADSDAVPAASVFVDPSWD